MVEENEYIVTVLIVLLTNCELYAVPHRPHGQPGHKDIRRVRSAMLRCDKIHTAFIRTLSVELEVRNLLSTASVPANPLS